MKYLDEYRDADSARRLADAIARITSGPHTLMEICGGQTHSIVKYGIDELLPDNITLIHGPGCPVCVTPVALIDKAVEIAGFDDVIFCSFGDMLRVPGSEKNLLTVKSEGGDVRIVYAPVDAVKLAQKYPDKSVVFFAVGFETTAPANAMAVDYAKRHDVYNFSMLVSHVLVPPAIEAILSAPDNRVEGFLAAGHVCTVMGYEEYIPIAREFHLPIVVTGFEPVDILQGIHACIQQIECGHAEVENQYKRAVRRQGNEPAIDLIARVFTVIRRQWRGIGEIPRSGLGLSAAYQEFDAERRFELATARAEEPAECISGMILQGVKKPHQCAAFATRCTPEVPLGAPMVSTEGACAAYYRYRRVGKKSPRATEVSRTCQRILP
ncbi:MAG: hydrogenase formation protein HypD [Planctomycetota bacterium]|jgi:hydrogenase expression/formation protein HypD